MPPVVLTFDLLSVDLMVKDDLGTPAEMFCRLSVRGPMPGFSVETAQSSHPLTTSKLSLRENSIPRDVFTGPKGADMTGRGVRRRLARRVAAWEGAELRSHEAVVERTSLLGGLTSIVGRSVLQSNCSENESASLSVSSGLGGW